MEIRRALAVGMVGEDVALLHWSLLTIGIEIADEEREAKHYGETTRAAVLRLQATAGLPPTGELDEATLQLARTALELMRKSNEGAFAASRPTVHGVVHDSGGLPVAGLTVVAYERALRGAAELARARTDARGAYTITYRTEHAAPDLELVVHDAHGATLATSEIHYRVSKRTEISFVLGGGSGAPSEHAAMTRALAPRLGSVAADELVENAKFRDLTFLAGDTGLARPAIALYSAAARAARITNLPPELFYGLLRQRVPTDAAVVALASTSEGVDLDGNAQRLLDAIYAASPEVRATALHAAIAGNQIPASYAPRAEQDLAELALWAREAALGATDGFGKTSIGTLLETATLTRDQQRTFVGLLTAQRGSMRAFWSGLYKGTQFSRPEISRLRFTLQIGRFTRGHLPLVSRLVEMRGAGAIKGGRDLARLTAASWKTVLTEGNKPIGLPENFTAATPELALEGYARMLERRFERAYPTTAFSARLAEDRASPIAARDAVVAFLDANPAFSLRKTHLDRFLHDRSKALGNADRATLARALLPAQRMFKLGERYAVVKPLLADGLHSSRQIYAMGRDRFVQTYAAVPEIGAVQATRVYAMAEQTYAVALGLAMRVNRQLVGPGPVAITPPAPAPPPSPTAPPSPASTPSPSLTDFPNLATLFGSLDSCSCTECRSVLSAAAYLVDLLHFLGHRTSHGTTAAAVLLGRRPDLAQIELSCPNTNNVLPYIDLANELLEDAVAPPADPIAAARARQTTLTTDELNANPEHINPAAYAALATAVYPWSLPFDLPLAEARTYLGQLGVDRIALMRAVLPIPALGSPAAIAMAVDGLGLSAVEADVITGAAAHDPWQYYGLAETGNTVRDPVNHDLIYSGAWLAVLGHARVLLDRAGLDYRGLARLLATSFINPDGTVELNPASDGSCDLATMTVAGLTADVLDRLHRFVRLRRRTGWDVADLDAAIGLLQATTAPDAARLNSTLLRQLDAVRRVMARFRIAVAPAVALLAGIATHDVPALPGEDAPRYALYHDLFQNLAVLNPVDPIFVLDAAGSEIAGIAGAPQLADHRAALAGALQLSDGELTGAIAALTDGHLTLANLSVLHRHVTLATGLGVTPTELRSLLALVEEPTGAAPFFRRLDPFDASQPELLDWFCDAVDRLRATPFSIAQLDYLLRHSYEPTSGVAPDSVQVGTLLKSIRDGLIKLAGEDPVARAAHGTSLIVQQLVDALGLPTATVAKLVTAWLRSGLDPSKPLVDELATLAALPRAADAEATPITPGEPGFAPFFARYTALHKAAQVLAGFGLTADEIEWLRSYGAAVGWLDPTVLPLAAQATAAGGFARWRRLADAAALRSQLPSDGTSFTALLDRARTGGDKASYLAAVALRTRWSTTSLASLAGDPGNVADHGLLGLVYPDDYQSERALSRLAAAFAVLRRLGIAADVSSWLGVTVTAAQADAIKQSVKAKYAGDQWLAIAKTLRDGLRQQQRDALVAWLLAHPPAGARRWHTANDLYAYYLIDVEMCACQATSRVVQANATIQLFVQRCILNLEPQVTVDADADIDWLQWQWMSRYRVWQANRKVFLYPENWIEPSLRRDKSPFFKDLENELLQNTVTTEAAEDAFHNYLTKLDAIARLDVVGFFHEFQSDVQSVLHVVGRKQGNPPTHYYRTWVDNARWTAWLKIDVDLVSDHVLPVVWNHRLYLFWSVVTRKPDATQDQPGLTLSNTGGSITGGQPPQPSVHLELQLAWSELRAGKWQPTQTAPQVVVVPHESSASFVTLKSAIDDPVLRIHMFEGDAVDRYHVATFTLGGVGNAVEAFTSYSSTALVRVGTQTGLLGTLPAYKGQLLLPPSTYYDAMTMRPETTTKLSTARPRVAPLNTSFYATFGVFSSETVLARADFFRLMIAHQDQVFDSTLPFFYADAARSYFVIPAVFYRVGNYFQATPPPYVYAPYFKIEYTFEPNYHPFVPLLIQRLNVGGLDALFARGLQLDPAHVQGAPALDFASYYQPTNNVELPYPTEGIDFDPRAGYALYNWELFFHAPFQIGEALSANQQFADAKHWYEYVFNPTSASSAPSPQRYWVTKPFFQMTAADYADQQIDHLLDLINHRDAEAEHQVAEWRAHPFDPHVIAGMRPVAYQRAIVMKYLDNLIAWGDNLFRQATLESVNEAAQLYVLAQEILGPRPEIVPRRRDADPMTYAELAGSLDEFSDVVAAAESAIAPVVVHLEVDPATPKLPVLPALYFCVPPNDALLKYWDTVEDRLYKIRHCMNIAGVFAPLALFAPPIDPAMLVRAAAAGLDLGSILNDSAAALPPYRFRILVRQALELAMEVRMLGADLSSALQLRDAERLALLRADAEKKLQTHVRDVHVTSLAEARQQLEVVGKTRAVVVARQDHFADLKDAVMNDWEAAAMVMTAGSVVANGISLGLESAAGTAHAFPDAQFGGSGVGGSPHVTAKLGGANVGNSASAWATVSRIAAAVLQTGAQMSTAVGQYQRRHQDDEFGYTSATLELAEFDAQATAAQLRIELVQHQLANQDLVIEAASDIQDYLHDKFTNRELYDWMIGKISGTYFQAYQLAYAVAQRAEQCFRHELAIDDSSYIQFGYWDSLKKGLLAADGLLHDLRRMEAAYLAQHARELELTKHASLLALDPLALVALRRTGECTVTLPELWFDLETPGHYLRRLKTVSVTVPCVAGSYTGVSVTLTLLDSHVRTTTVLTPQYARSPGSDARFVDFTGGTSAIVTSHGQRDTGMFAANLEDDRYLPFEGEGAIGTWNIRLNAVYPQVDPTTISDVILHLNYTARDAGAVLRGAAQTAVQAQLNALALAGGRKGLYQLLSARQQYATAWRQFVTPGAGVDQVLVLDVPPARFPFFSHGLDVKVTGIDVIARVTDAGDYTLVITRPGAADATVAMTVDLTLGGLHTYRAHPIAPASDLGRAGAAGPPPQLRFRIQRAGAADFRSLTEAEIDDLVVILQYTVTA